jgi:LAS superfamily LD-carboxypeptidase LdcB
MQVWWRQFYCFFSSCDYAAVPGTSVHGWGRAVDFEDSGGELTFSSAGYRWLQAHAAEFGFFHPAWAEQGGSSPEPWHWEHS